MNLKKSKLIYVFLIGMLFTACETLDLESLIENPNALGESSADPNFIFNTMQLNFRDQSEDMGNTVDGPMRMAVSGASYNASAGPTILNGEWSRLYGFNQDFTFLNNLAAEDENLRFLAGASKIMKAAMFTWMVDLTDDVVFSEANNVDFPNPGLDDGASVYNELFTLIDEGIADLESGQGNPPINDLYFDGDRDKWIRFANSFKLKMHLTTRLVRGAESTSGINALIAADNLMETVADDMDFTYGVDGPPQESRHPFFTGNYITGAGAYMPNFLMSWMRDSSAVEDPRMLYYFYRMTTRDPANSQELPCLGDANFPYCNIGDGYWGRDHGDPNAIPNDRNLRTVYGVYPARGAFDNQFVDVVDANTQGGSGIHPVMLSSWTQFMLAEAALTLGTTGDPADYLERAIRLHIQKVIGFLPSESPGNTAINTYVDDVLADFNAAGNDEKLDIIAREWYIASWGNATETFNTYRRTAYPSFLLDPVQNLGDFMRRFPLPQNERNVNTNPDFTETSILEPVFWDNNPAGILR